MISAKEAAKTADEVNARAELQPILTNLEFISKKIRIAAQQGKKANCCLIPVNQENVVNACVQELKRLGFSVNVTTLPTETQLDIKW